MLGGLQDRSSGIDDSTLGRWIVATSIGVQIALAGRDKGVRLTSYGKGWLAPGVLVPRYFRGGARCIRYGTRVRRLVRHWELSRRK